MFNNKYEDIVLDNLEKKTVETVSAEKFINPIIIKRIDSILGSIDAMVLFATINSIQQKYNIQVINVDNISTLPNWTIWWRLRIWPWIWIPFKEDILFKIIDWKNIIDCRDIQFDEEWDVYWTVKTVDNKWFSLLYKNKIITREFVENFRDVTLDIDGNIYWVTELSSWTQVPFVWKREMIKSSKWLEEMSFGLKQLESICNMDIFEILSGGGITINSIINSSKPQIKNWIMECHVRTIHNPDKWQNIRIDPIHPESAYSPKKYI